MESHGEVMPTADTARLTDNKWQLLWHTIVESGADRVLAAAAEEEAAAAATAAASPTGGDEGSVQQLRVLAGRGSEQYVTRSFAISDIAHQSN